MKYENSFQKNTIFLTIGTVLNKGLQFFAVLFYSRWLSTEEYGQFDLLYTYISLLIPIITFSNQEAIFRFSVNEKKDHLKNAYISSGFFFDTLNFIIVVCLFYVLIGKKNQDLYALFSIYLFAELISTYLRGFLRAIKRLDIYSFALVLQTVLMFIFISIYVSVLNWGLKGMLLGYASGTICGDVVLIIWGKLFHYLHIGDISFARIKDLLAYSFPLVPNEISWWVMNASDRQIINIFFGDLANGIFAIAHKIPALCSVVFNMFAISWQQEIVTKVENNEDPNTNVVFNQLLIILFSVCSCLMAGSFVFYYYFFDVKYFEAIKYSPILIASALCMAIAQFFGGIQAAYKRTKNTGMTTLVGASVNVICHIILINWIGLFAAAVSTLIANLIIIVLRINSVKDVYQVVIHKKTIVTLLTFGYFSISTYFYRNMLWNWVNSIASIALLVVLNLELLQKVLINNRKGKENG